MWKDLSTEWQIVLEEAWNAFISGSIPIGAAIFDKDGRLLAKGHNTCSEKAVLNPKMAHAEMNVLQRLDCRTGLNVREVDMYSSMEPCPMCLGAIVMGNIKHLSCGAHDRWCGALHLLDTDPYMRSQRIQLADFHLLPDTGVMMIHQEYFLVQRHMAVVNLSDADPAHIFVIIYGTDQDLKSCIRITLRRRNIV